MTGAPGTESRLVVNGVERRYAGAPPATVAALLEELGLDPARVVAEVDGRVTPKDAFGDTRLNDGARVELAHFVGGG
jgi:thiamine biosynthesis protein ThiS